MKSLIVNEKWNKKKLNSFLLENLEGLSMNMLYKALRKKDIRINEKRIHENVCIYTGDRIDIYLVDELLTKKQDIPIIYQDDNIMLVNKPSKIEVTGTNSLTSLLKQSYPTLEPCHRLDRNTTGLVLFAKNEQVLTVLLQKFKNHKIEKHYACHVYNIPRDTTKMEVAYLFKDAKKSQVYISPTPKKGYLKIITAYTILQKQENNTCMLDINLHTGRTHQIRAHMAYLGYPIIGDGKYGNNEVNKKFKVNMQQLCAYYLKFDWTNEHTILDYLNQKEFQIPYTF